MIEIPTLTVAALAPQIVLVIAALGVMLADLYIEDKRIVGYLAVGGLVAAAIPILILLGGDLSNPLMFQDMIVTDGFSLVMGLVFIVAGILGVLISISYLDNREMQRGEYYALLLFSIVGMMLMAAGSDLIVIFMGLEIMSIALYILSGFNRSQPKSSEAGMKYFVLGAFASAFFLYGAALLYGATGYTNLYQMGEWFTADTANLSSPLALAGLGLLLVGFAFKVSAIPFQWWTPDVYEGAPTSVTAFMSVGAKAAGFAALTRVLFVAFGETFVTDWQFAVGALAVLTMTGGNIAAIAQTDAKRMLAYSSIAHAGYLLVGVAAANAAGASGILFYLMAYAFVNVGAFGVVALLEKRDVVGTQIKDYIGLGYRYPLIALAMAMFMFSLTGLPPFIGFWGKLYVFRAAVEGGVAWLAAFGVLNSAISAYYYVGIVVQMYMRTSDESEEESSLLTPESFGPPIMVGLGVAVVLTILLGVWPTPLFDLTALGLFG